MALLNVLRPGDTLVYSPADAAGDSFANDGTPQILVTLPTARTLTVESGIEGLPDYTRLVGPGQFWSSRFDPLRYNRPDIGRLVFRFNDVDGVTVMILAPGVEGFGDSESLSGSLIE